MKTSSISLISNSITHTTQPTMVLKMIHLRGETPRGPATVLAITVGKR